MTDLAEHLRQVVPPDRVSDDPNDLDLHASDFWPRLVMARRRGEELTRPAVVVSPSDRDEVAAVLRWCHEHGVPLVPYGAGTGVCGGAAAVDGAITLDLKRLDHIGEIDEVSGTVTVGPGVICQALEDHLRHRGWTLGHHPSSAHCSTMGGFLAIRSAGQASTGFGKLEEMVIGLEVVLADGTVVTSKPVPQSAAGPDLKRLFLGSEGTLGVITGATLRLRRRPETVLDRGVHFAGFDDGVEGLRRLIQRGIRPTVLRLYDEADTALVFGQQGLEVDGGCMLVYAAEGDDDVARFVHDRTLAVLTEAGAEDLGPEPGEHWRAHRHDVSYRFAEYMRPGGTFGDAVMLDTMEVASVWARLPLLYEEVRAALSAHTDLVLAHVSHVYETGAAIYFTFGAAPTARGDDLDEEAAERDGEERYSAAWDAGQRAVLRVGGTISHHHGIGRLRVPWFAEELGPGGVELLERVKGALDPAGVMNPGVLALGASGGADGTAAEARR